MLVLHFSVTPLAGMPIRLVQALNRHAGVTARLVDLKRFGLYDHDIVFEEDPDQALALARQADVIHLHNYLDYASTAFSPIDFAALARSGAAVIRQFHTEPAFVARKMGLTPEELLAQDIPCLAIAQHTERLYPKALVVPNFVPEDDPALAPATDAPDWDVFFGPTMYDSAWDDRWNTKGAPEMTRILDVLARDTGARVLRFTDKLSLQEALALKRRSRIVTDDMVTGTWHLTGLEGLAQAKPVLAFLDDRVLFLLRHFSGAPDHPFVNVRLEDAPGVLARLVRDPGLCREIGQRGRRWLFAHWTRERMIGHYKQAYELAVRDPVLVRRQPELAIDSPARRFFAVELPDQVYAARRDAFLRAGASTRPQAGL